MLGILLIALGQTFHEVGSSISKYEAEHRKESIYAIGFLNAIWATIFLILITLFWSHNFVFTLAGLPTFLARAILEIILLFTATNAIIKADRSTFSFLHVTTIPVLILIDFALGYRLTDLETLGITAIVIALIILFIDHGLSKRGKLLSLVAAMLAVGTISLYKYNITHHNSVEAEQIVMHIIILLCLLIVARWRTGENLFRYLTHKIFLIQSIAAGVGGVFVSFAYLFAPASIITTAKRSFEILVSMVSGRVYFKEKRLSTKLATAVLIIIGLGFLGT